MPSVADDHLFVRHRNVNLLYHLSNEAVRLPALLDTIHGLQQVLVERLGWAPRWIEIEIYGSREEWVERHTSIDAKELNSWVQGDSGRVIRLFLGGKATPEKLGRMVMHEIVHAAVKDITGDSAPAWLDEGLAVCLSQDLPEGYRNVLDEAVAADAVLPLETLTESFVRFDRGLQKLAYAQSHALVIYLAERFGWEAIRDILNGCGAGRSVERTLKALGLTGYLLEREWLLHTRGL